MSKIYKKLIQLLFILFIGCVFFGCNNYSQQPVPTYIHVDSFSFKQTYGFGVTTHQITAVWAYYNNSPIGSFDLPATFPVIATGNGTLELSPAIAIDGLNSLMGVYPFYKIDTFNFTAQPGKIITHEPSTQYYSDAIDTPISNFKFGRTGFAVWEATGTPMTIVTTDSLTINGSPVGCITLNAGTVDSVIDSSTSAFSIPTNTPAFIEIDYKCDVPFAMGLQTNLDGIYTSPYYIGGVYPSNTWQKFYLSVADFAAQYKGTSYNFYIKAVLPYGQSSGKIYLDNIQLLHF